MLWLSITIANVNFLCVTAGQSLARSISAVALWCSSLKLHTLV